MKHKVTCMDCGKTERIIIQPSDKITKWGYYGKINVNGCKTSKYFLKPKDQKNILGECEKIPNSCYDASVKPKYVELWSCPQCMSLLKGDKE